MYNMDDETKKTRNKENKKLYYVNNLEKIKERENLRYETKKQIMTEEQKQQQKAERKAMKEARHRQLKYKHNV